MQPIYNRTTKLYDIRINTDQTLSFKTKETATQALIALRHRPLYNDIKALVTRHPQLTSRAWKAAWLCLANSIHKNPAGDYTVTSQTDPNRTYNIPPTLDRCIGCPDETAPVGPVGRHYCKHRIAIILNLRHPDISPEQDYANTITEFLADTGRV